MERKRSLLILGLLGLLSAGCIMAVAVRAPVTALPDNKKIVEIDDELYLLDLEAGRVQKLDKRALVETQSITFMETPVSDD